MEKAFDFHKDQLQEFRKLKSSDELPHAMIFYGQAGCGHLELALKFAREIVVPGDEHSLDPKTRASFEKAKKLIHPDIHFSFPFVGNVTSNEFLEEWRSALLDNPFIDITHWMQRLGAENKQANINAKECSNILQKLSLKSFESKYKVLLMWLPEYLGKEGNRLLKMIEEPPENTIFLLVTEQLDRILNTIISRCRLIYVESPTDDQISDRLIHEMSIDQERADQISFLADGDYGFAISIALEEGLDFSDTLFSWLRLSYKLKPEEIVKWCDEMSKLSKAQQKYFVLYALKFFRVFLLLDNIPDEQIRLTKKELELARKMQRFIDLDFLESIENILNESYRRIERNANVKMLYMNNSIEMNKLFHGVKLT